MRNVTSLEDTQNENKHEDILKVIEEYKAYKVSRWGSFTFFANPFLDRGINKADRFAREYDEDNFVEACTRLLNEKRYISSCHKDSLISRLLYCAEFQRKVLTLGFNVEEKIALGNSFADIIQDLKDHIKSLDKFEDPADATRYQADNRRQNTRATGGTIGSGSESERNRPTEVSTHDSSRTF